MKKKWSIVILIACLIGYLWIGFQQTSDTTISGCYMQWLYHFPCPTCGITRSIIAVLEGNLKLAIYENPLGILAVLSLLLFPIWIIFDFLFEINTFETSVNKCLKSLRYPKYLILFSSVFIITWTWNIYKYLCI